MKKKKNLQELFQKLFIKMDIQFNPIIIQII